MTEKQFNLVGSYLYDGDECISHFDDPKHRDEIIDLLNNLYDENEQLKQELKRCKDWINFDENDYELTLSFIKSKGYSLKDVLEYEKELLE